MDLKIKKYIYLINDLTGLILKKERIQEAQSAKKLRQALIATVLALALSLFLNILLLVG